MWSIKKSPECNVCKHTDNLEHYFYYCPDTASFWTDVKNWLKPLLSINFEFSVLEILLGAVNISKDYYYTVNYVILTGKYFIYKSKKTLKHLFFHNFLKFLKWRLKLEFGAYINQDRAAVFK